jgi:hypothetical protein
VARSDSINKLLLKFEKTLVVGEECLLNLSVALALGKGAFTYFLLILFVFARGSTLGEQVSVAVLKGVLILTASVHKETNNKWERRCCHP